MDTANEDYKAVAETLSGDTAAFGIIVRKYQKLLYDLAVRMIGNPEEAEDLTQTAFLRMYAKLPRYNSNYPFRTWAYTVALNLIRNSLRKKAVMRFIDFSSWRNSAGEEINEFVHDPRQNTEGAAQASELLLEIEKAAGALSFRLKSAFILFHFHNSTPEDIANAMDITPNAVNILLCRASCSHPSGAPLRGSPYPKDLGGQ